MKTATKVWLIVAASLILIGIMLFAGVMISIKWNFHMLNTNKFISTEHEISDSFESILINTDTANVNVMQSDDGKCYVKCYEQERISHSVTVEDGTLKIQRVDTRRWYEYIGISFGSTNVKVYLPKAEYESLTVNDSTGDVNIWSESDFDNISITTSTGDIQCYASAKGKMTLNAGTGDIIITDSSTGSLDLSVSTGKIHASSVKCGGDINIKVGTGDVGLTDITCKNLISEGGTGELTMRNVIASECFDVKRSTGDVRFESCDAGEVTIVTDTGDVKGSLLSEKVFIVNTDTGRKDVPESTTGGKCKVTTDTGDIKIIITKD